MQAEIDFHIRLNTDAEIADYIYHEFDEYESSLDQDFMSFKKATVEPIWTLRYTKLRFSPVTLKVLEQHPILCTSKTKVSTSLVRNISA